MDGWIKIGTKLDTDDFDSQIKYIESQMEEIQYKLKQADLGYDVGDTNKLEAQYEKLGHQLTKLKQKQEDLNKVDLSNVQKSIDNASKSTSSIIKKMGKWALAIFGIRQAYGFIRNSVATLSQYNEKLSNDLNYIKFAMASALQPVIEKMVSLVYLLLQYVNYIAQAWFGVNLFANASANAMKSSAKSAKEMKNSLAGFDEMNTVGSSSTDASSGLPSTDLSMEEGEVPKWLQWIGDNKELILSALTGIATALVLIKLGVDAVIALGIGALLAGIVLTIQGLIAFIKDPSWYNFLTLLQGISLVIAGISILMGGWIVAIIALGIAIVAYLVQNWDKVKGILGSVGNWIYDNIIKPVKDFFIGLWESIVNGVKNAFNAIKNTFNSVVNFFRNIISTIVNLFKDIGIKVGNVIGSAFKSVINGILSAIEGILNTPIRAINGLIGVINKVPGVNLSKLSTFNLPRLKSGGIINLPGRGIPVGSAIGGEAGKEGVLPLTDSQAMEELGSAIGRYITINLTNNTNLDGKTIARHQSKVQANRNFAMNR